MKKIVLLLTLFLSPLSSLFSTCFAQGTLAPLGAPQPTMKTLAQIEPRTPIASAPFTISQPGSYYLTTNLTVSSGNAITIATNQVTLDLGGFTISSTGPSATGYAILLGSGVNSITIANGFIQGSVTNNGAGVYNGGGFLYGISFSLTGSAPVNTLISRVSISGCWHEGIYLSQGDSTMVESCTVRTVGGVGIQASTVKNSLAFNCGGGGILGYQISDCQGQSFSDSGIGGTTVLNCYGYSSTYHGLSAVVAQNCYGQSIGNGTRGLTAKTAQNCYGRSSSGIGLAAQTALNSYGLSDTDTGLDADTAQNCSGESQGDGRGIRAGNASNCSGYSDGSGQGIYAETASNCYGKSALNRGLFANIAISCSGRCDGGSYGLFATSVANSCYGYSASGTGLNAYIAIGCTGSSISYSFHYNMP